MKTIGFLLVALFIAFSSVSTAKLKDPSNQADYLIIGTSGNQNTLQDFISWRSSKGLSVTFCNIDDIYAEFGEVNSKHEAIRSFIKYSFDFWKSPKPKYVLIAGGINLIPSFKIKSYLSLDEDSVSCDRLFGVLSSSFTETPAVMVGRIPARTKFELQEFISKTMNFEDNFSFGNYSNEATFVAERREEYGEVLVGMADEILKKYFASAKSNFLTFDSDTIDPLFKQKYINSINKGTTLFIGNFFAGNTNKWGRNQFLKDYDIDISEFLGFPMIFVAISSTQNCFNLSQKSLLEQLLIKGNKGAVASIAPTSLNYAELCRTNTDEFFNNLLEKRYKTLGEAVQNIPESNLFGYYGDPALKNPYSQLAGINEPDNNDEISVFPNPASDRIGLKFNSVSDGNIRISIYSILGNQIADVRDYQSIPRSQTIFFNIENFQIGLYLLKIQMDNKTFIKQFLKTN